MNDEPQETSLEYLPSKIATPDQESEVVDFINKNFDDAKRFDASFKLDCFNDWLYKHSVLPGNWGNRFFTKNFVPETMIAARTSCEQTMASLMPTENFFDIWGNEGQDEVAVEKLRVKAKHELLRSNYKIGVYFWGMETIDYGNGVMSTMAEPQWSDRTTYEDTPDPSGFGVDLGFQRKQVREIDIRFRMRVVSRFDCFPYPGGYNDIQQMPFFIVREFVPLSEFRVRAKWKGWKNADKVHGWLFSERASANEGTEFETDNLYLRLAATRWAVNDTTSSVESIRWVELRHYYEAPPGGTGCRAYAVVADVENLMCCRARPYDHAQKPINDLIWQPLDSQLWQAIGVPRLMRSYQDQINVREARFSDMQEFANNPMRIAGPNFGVNPLTRILPKPGRVVHSTGDIKDIRLLEMPQADRGHLEQSDRAHIGIERMTLTDLRGVVGTGASQDATNTTARGKQIYTDNQKQVAAFMTFFQEERGISQQLQQVVSLCQQYAKQDGQTLPIRGKNDVLSRAGALDRNLVTLQPRDIMGEFTVRAVGSVRAMESPTRAQIMMELFEKGAGMPEIRDKYSWARIFENVYEQTMHRPASEFELTEAEKAEKAKVPPPLPDPSLPKFKDLKEYPHAAAAALNRAGLPGVDIALTEADKIKAEAEAAIQIDEAKQTAGTIAQIVTAHTKPPPPISTDNKQPSGVQ